MEYRYDESILHDLPPEKQKEEMEKWFRSKYEDPAQNCPCDGGEYVWSYGGPYDALEELLSEFSGVVPDIYIEGLTKELEKECWFWSAIPAEDVYDIDYIDSFIEVKKDAFCQFTESLAKCRLLLEMDNHNELKNTLYKMLYANIITSMETYLSETFVTRIFESKDFLCKFLCLNKDFKDKKFTLNEIYSNDKFVENKVKEYLAGVLWHNLKKVANFYKTINVSFPDNIDEIYASIETRHDIVHRNGKSRDGEDIIITQQDVLHLSAVILGFIKNIEEQINHRPLIANNVY